MIAARCPSGDTRSIGSLGSWISVLARADLIPPIPIHPSPGEPEAGSPLVQVRITPPGNRNGTNPCPRRPCTPPISSHATPGRELAVKPSFDGAAVSLAEIGPMYGARTVALYTPCRGSVSDPLGLPCSSTGALTHEASPMAAAPNSPTMKRRLALMAPLFIRARTGVLPSQHPI